MQMEFIHSCLKFVPLYVGLFFCSNYLISKSQTIHQLIPQSREVNHRLKLTQRVLSMTNALTLITLGSYSLYQDPHWIIHENTYLQKLICEFCMGYFLVDSCFVLLKEFDPKFVLHHFLALSCSAVSLYYGKGAYYGAIMVIPAELSNPFQITWEISHKYKLEKLHKIVGPIFAFSFLILRNLVMFPITSYSILHMWSSGSSGSLNFIQLMTLTSCLISLNLANFFWSYLVINGFIKHLKKTHKKIE